MSLKELREHLNTMGVPYEVVVTKPGDSLYVKAGKYHAVEAEGNHIMVNEYLGEQDVQLNEKFSKIWKVWYERNAKY
jgi:D-lyxose ketol-isomerase